MKPYIWTCDGRFYVSPRGSYSHQVQHLRTYPRTADHGYPSLSDAMDATMAALTLAPS